MPHIGVDRHAALLHASNSCVRFPCWMRFVRVFTVENIKKSYFDACAIRIDSGQKVDAFVEVACNAVAGRLIVPDTQLNRVINLVT